MPTNATPFIRFNHVTQRYRRSWWQRDALTVLDDLHLTLNAGEMVALMGPSGVGKSTLTRLLMGLEAPTQGTVTIDGLPARAWREAHPGGMAAVFQDYSDALNPDLTIASALTESAEIAHRAPPDVATLLDEVGLSVELAPRYPHQLSGGQRQRVCLARAVASHAQIVLFDEALSSLDVITQGEMITFLKRHHPKDALWLFVTHDLENAVTLADRLLVLGEGRVLLDIATNDIKAELERETPNATLKAMIDAERARQNAFQAASDALAHHAHDSHLHHHHHHDDEITQ